MTLCSPATWSAETALADQVFASHALWEHFGAMVLLGEGGVLGSRGRGRFMESVSGLLTENELPLLHQPYQLSQALPDGLWQHQRAQTPY